MTARKDPPENAVAVISTMAASGHKQISIAKALGVSYDTYLRWKEDHAEIQEALDQGLAAEHDLLVGSLLESAIKQKNVTAAIFLLKARHGYRENKEIHANRPQITINFELPGAVTPNVYEAEILKKSIPKKDLKKIGC
ncbi:MAG: hypothetical protein PF482_07960 [Desulfobacteraceae bacterium]|jgi:transposase|nr:hypothetical protein [Desulfobacteraceae bacterium]